ncbi:uncharacterized protein F5147DRAFT_770225 [Suillus discolor]|uniref:Uncharacterized protein n=1 Tax=Suillus discolor TaxID=1912936 RepID=A0A9P7FE08_9AGAM|nr:uncharacterized protein F5147DRAFT_770225 [Suillus discolor]KAG2114228.1 hypothetical protein F5147DRAFT_770225 [Suillus discolor]
MFPRLIRTSGSPVHVLYLFRCLYARIPVPLHIHTSGSDIWTPDFISTSQDLRIQPMLHIRTQTLNQCSSPYGNHLFPDPDQSRPHIQTSPDIQIRPASIFHAFSLCLGRNSLGQSSAPPLLRSSAPPLLRSSAPPLLRSSAPPILQSSIPPSFRKFLRNFPAVLRTHSASDFVPAAFPLTKPRCNFRKFLRNFPAPLRKFLTLIQIRIVLPDFLRMSSAIKGTYSGKGRSARAEAKPLGISPTLCARS